MNRSTDRILTTHCGSLARPKEVLDLMKAKLDGKPYDHKEYASRVRGAVVESIRKQAACGIDVVADGEMSKPGFFTYLRDRLTGFEHRQGAGLNMFADERAAFPEYYEHYFGSAMLGGAISAPVNLTCVGPITYRGHDALRTDIDNLKTAIAGVDTRDVFMPSSAPSGAGINEYYPSEEAYMHAVADAMRVEYQAIIDAGFLIQIDDPFLSDIYADSSLNAAAKDRRAEVYVEAINYGLEGIPAERVRFHTCYGINHGPRVHDAALIDIVPAMLRINAQAYSFEAANVRHEHEYHVWEKIKLPPGKLIIPGVITHASNIVEHPDLIAEWLVRYAKIVGRENVIAGADCGFSSQATYNPEVHPKVVWAKFEAMAEGARIASRQLWN